MHPTTIGRYQILRTLGQGGMATVFEGFDATLNRHVAIKVPDAEVLADPQAVQRLLQEATKIARLEAHRAILTIYEADVDSSRPFIAMRKVDGGSLEQRLQASVQPLEFTRRIVAAIGSALEYAHRHGIVHCDVKPSNILLDALGQPYLTDFGISRARPDALGVRSDDSFGYTMQYASPEQMAGTEPTPRSDIYSLGVVAFEMLTGAVPFGHVANAEALRLAKSRQPVPKADAIHSRVPSLLASVVARAMAPAALDRFASANEFVAAFLAASGDSAVGESLTRVAAAATAGERPPANPRRRGTRLVVGVAVAITLVGVAVRRPWAKETSAPASTALDVDPGRVVASTPPASPATGRENSREVVSPKPTPPPPEPVGKANPTKLDEAVDAGVGPPVGQVTNAAPQRPSQVEPSASPPSGPPSDAAAAAAPVASYRLPVDWEVTACTREVGALTGLPKRVVAATTEIEFVLVEPGRFTMGDDRGGADEQPAHAVAMSRAFYMSRTEVTVGQLRKHAPKGGAPAAALANPFLAYWRREAWDDRHPASKVTRSEAAAFARHHGCRLPTEAQWEFAARAGTTTRYWFGDDLADGEGCENGHGPATLKASTSGLYPDGYYGVRAWPFDDAFLQTAPAGSFRASPWGLVDMLGNVQEWVRDAYDPDAYRKRLAAGGPVRDPVVEDPDVGLGIVRGGGWNTDPKAARASARHAVPVDARREGIGFRIVREIE